MLLNSSELLKTLKMHRLNVNTCSSFIPVFVSMVHIQTVFSLYRKSLALGSITSFRNMFLLPVEMYGNRMVFEFRQLAFTCSSLAKSNFTKGQCNNMLKIWQNDAAELLKGNQKLVPYVRASSKSRPERTGRKASITITQVSSKVWWFFVGFPIGVGKSGIKRLTALHLEVRNVSILPVRSHLMKRRFFSRNWTLQRVHDLWRVF